MRKTGPVTQVEVPLSDSDQLVSSTNAKGVITTANDTFCRVAGFTREELLGQAHNIVRHADMPQAAFQLLWDTIEQGKPWRGIVKNRCKNGDHYWVDAYVTPVYEGSKIVGYESVRQKPKADWVKRAEQVYQNINTGKPPLPAYHRFIDKNLHLVKAGALGIAGLILALIFGGQWGWLLGLIFLAMTLVIPSMFSAHKQIDEHLSAFNDDALTQYIFTGRLNRASRVTLLQSFHKRHLHTVLERMDQMGAALMAMSETNQARVRQEFETIENERTQLDAVAAAVQEMSNSIQEIAGSAQNTAETTGQANTEAQAGLENLTQATHKIQTLVRTMNQTEESVNQLSEKSNEIRNVITTISGIAEQTNLLALNAAIEAARAGEQGRGFAVVADEVRSLAQRTQESTQDITDVINQLVETTENSANSIKTGVSISHDSMAAIENAQQAIESLARAMSNVNSNTEIIADLSQQQSIASNEISSNSEAVLQLTAELAESAKETMAFSDELRKQSELQANIIRRFR